MPRITLPADQTEFTATGLDYSRSYTFRVSAVSAMGEGAAATASAATIDPLPAPPPFNRPRGDDGSPTELVWARWNGWEFGSGTDWEVTQVTGLASMPSLKTGDQARNQQAGVWPGQDWAGLRQVAIDMRIVGCLESRWRVQDLVAATYPQLQEAELLINGRWTLFSRPRRREVTQPDEGYNSVVAATVQWEASDPNIYDLEETAWTTLSGDPNDGRLYAPAKANDADPIPSGYAREFAMPGDAAGTSLGWQYPGTGRLGGFIQATNQGLVPSWRLRAQITGPCLNPQLIHVESQEHLLVEIDLAAGDQLVLDWWDQAITLGGESRYMMLSSDSRWWPLGVGVNSIRFDADRFDAGARADFWWRSAN